MSESYKSHANDPVWLEKEAFRLKREGKFSEAIDKLRRLLELAPTWEHGYGAYLLADCLENAGRLEEAKNAYFRALEHAPNNSIFLGGCASFLYLHGTPKEAFDCYLKLLEVERENSLEDRHQLIAMIRNLAQKMALPSEDLEQAIESAMNSNSSLPTKVREIEG